MSICKELERLVVFAVVFKIYKNLWFFVVLFFRVDNPSIALVSGAWGRTRTGMRYCLEGF